MAKSLNDILKRYSDALSGKRSSTVNAMTTGDNPGIDYADKMKDSRDFIAQHSVEKFDDRVGNGDDVYNASNIKRANMERHGHVPNKKDIKAYKKNQQVGQPENVKEEAEITEKKDESEYGYEGDMAITQLKTICRNAENLMKMMKPNTDLPEWVQSKITKAEDYISTANEYLSSEMKEEVELDESDKLTKKQKARLNAAVFKASPQNPVNVEKKKRETEKEKKEFYNSIKKPTNEEVEELDEAGSQYRSAAGSGKNTNPNLSRLARKLAFEKPKSYRPPGEKSKAENRAMADDLVAKFMKKGGKIRKEETEVEEAKMCESCGKTPCGCDATEPKDNGKDKPGKRKLLTDKKIQEMATSQAQQKLMAMAYRYKQNSNSMPDASDQVKKLASSMSKKQLRDFAATKHEGLPKKVEEAMHHSTRQPSADIARNKMTDAINKRKTEKMKLEQSAPAETPITMPSGAVGDTGRV